MEQASEWRVHLFISMGKSCHFPQTLFFSGIVSIQDLEAGTNLAAT